MGSNFSFIWSCTMYIHTICVIIHVHRVMMTVSFHHLSYPCPLLPLISLYVNFLHSSFLPHFPTTIIYHHPLIRENIQPLVFWDWPISLSMIFSNSNHLPENAIILFFLWLNNIPLCIYTTVLLSMHLLKVI